MKNGRNRVNGLLEEIEAEMNANWAEAHADDDYTREQAEADLLARHPLVAGMSSDSLIAIVALAESGEQLDDELVAVAAVVLERRLSAPAARRGPRGRRRSDGVKGDDEQREQ